MPLNKRALLWVLEAVAKPELTPAAPGPARHVWLASLAAQPIDRSDAARWRASDDIRSVPARTRTPWLLLPLSAVCLAVGATAGYWLGWNNRPANPYGQPVDHAEVQQVFDVGGAATSATFGTEGVLAVGTTRGAVTLIDMHGSRRTTKLADADAGPVTRAVFSPQGSVLAAGSDDGTVRLWVDPTQSSNEPPVILPMREDGEYGGAVNDVAFSPDGRILAVASSTSMVRIWDISVPEHPRALAAPSRPYAVTRLAFASHGNVLAVGSTDGTVKLWDMADPEDPQEIDGGLVEADAPVTALAFSEHKGSLAVGNSRGAVQLWDISDAEGPRKVDSAVAVGYTNDLSFNTPGYTLAASNSDGTVRLWENISNLTSPRLLSRPSSQGELSSVTFSDSDDTLAVTGTDGTVQIWSA
ncbi:WD40 repeat domain-containing protein [Streptomyces sp. enrichment culture]|uniref:WD40 repeat domain-containing protein n=1 Tax=Streptomyces sp. enrichment culture TaxID=1795815 RepID=UPI003F555A9D